MLSQSSYSTPLTVRGSGIQGLKDGLSTRRGPTELFGLGGARSPAPAQHPPQSPSIYGNMASSPPSPDTSLRPSYPASPGPVQGSSWLSRAEYALSAPSVISRCLELVPILGECPASELSQVFRLVLETVFCLSREAGQARDWATHSILRSQQPREYTAVADFLASKGPLLTAAGRLHSAPAPPLYSLPLSRLPPALAGELEGGGALASLLSPCLSSPSLGPCLHLSPLQLYLTTFAAYITQPRLGDNKLVAGESLYPFLLEDYLSYFLPCDGSAPPPLPGVSAPAPPPPPQPPISPATPARKSLLRQPFSPQTSSVSPPVSPPSQLSSSSPGTTWRSETLLSVLVSCWLPQFSPSAPSPPLSDSLKLLRMLLKHLHYFCNSGGPADISPLDPLKRSCLGALRPHIYTVFKHIFSHWPHDSSFRLVLETWLSYIQPWRYTDRSKGNGRPGGDSEPVAIDPLRWEGWVADNLLFYSTMVQLLLPRFFRMDLTSVKNAYMLFRVAKVLSQPGVQPLLEAAEQGLQGLGVGGRGALHFPPPVPVSEAVQAAARQGVTELEGVGHKYSPLTGPQVRQLVSELLGVAGAAAAAGRQTLAQLGPPSTQPASLWGWLVGGDVQSEGGEGEELRKAVHHLSASINSLAEVFSVVLEPEGEAGEVGTPASAGADSPLRSQGPEMVGGVLTPHGRWQVINGVCRGQENYLGDPDTRPITQLEVVWLVRRLYQFSQYLNLRYRREMVEVWGWSGLRGRVSRLLLQPPTTYYELERSVCGSPATRRVRQHPPRLSLRLLGHKRSITYLSCYLALLWLFGYSLFSSLLLLMIMAGVSLLLVGGYRWLIYDVLGTNTSSLLDTSDLPNYDDNES